jgi:hypothetical protein
VIYINLYYRLKYCGKTKLESLKKIRQNRNLEIVRNICIFIGIEIFYSIGIIFLSLTVTIERIYTILLDREIRNIIKHFFCKTKTTIVLIMNQQHKNTS